MPIIAAHIQQSTHIQTDQSVRSQVELVFEGDVAGNGWFQRKTDIIAKRGSRFCLLVPTQWSYYFNALLVTCINRGRIFYEEFSDFASQYATKWAEGLR